MEALNATMAYAINAQRAKSAGLAIAEISSNVFTVLSEFHFRDVSMHTST
jgi:hypothetical protein